MDRRTFLKEAALFAAAAGVTTLETGCKTVALSAGQPPFKISLAEWSVHRAIFNEKSMTNLDFPKLARREFGIDAVEYVNQFWMQYAEDEKYLAELKRVCEGEGVRSVLIMCDNEGNLGDPDDAKRHEAVTNHHKWARAAKFLGCHAIRVNARTNDVGSFDEQQKRAADGLGKLSEFCATLGLNCIVENHGGLSSNGQWLSGVMRMVNMKNCGTLPDFGNFQIAPGEMYDRYKGVSEMMPFAKAVSAKTNDFDDQGNEIHTDYFRMMKIVVDAGYHGRVGIEYEGDKMSEFDGIRASKRLLDRVLAEWA